MKWTEVLTPVMPDDETDPVVVVCLVPGHGVFRAVRTERGGTFGVLDVEGDVTAMQALTDVGAYSDHVAAAREHGLKFWPPDYVGPMSDLPQDLLLDDRWPLLFLYHGMHRQYFNLRQHFQGGPQCN